jgi:hypothetical protein
LRLRTAIDQLFVTPQAQATGVDKLLILKVEEKAEEESLFVSSESAKRQFTLPFSSSLCID